MAWEDRIYEKVNSEDTAIAETSVGCNIRLEHWEEKNRGERYSE